MYDKGKVLTGIVVFVVLMTFPVWFNGLKSAPAPEPKLPKDKKECVEATDVMKAEHMKLLNDWRDWVVRDKNRVYRAASGKKFTMSLSNTCMECHSSKKEFCDQCHNYMGVAPYCWDCHLEPEEKK